MVEATLEVNDDNFDMEMVRTSWFTSLIMNSSGNYKRPITPEKLYISKLAEANTPKKDVEAEKAKLKELFKL